MQNDFLNRIIHGDALTVLPTLPAGFFHTCVTSPPYFGLRSYNGIPATAWPEVRYSLWGFEVVVPPMTCELGHEADPKQFIGHMVQIFREVWRVMRDDGTVWLNMGDSYSAPGKDRTETQASKRSTLQGGLKTQFATLKQQAKRSEGVKYKDMLMIPAMLAIALRDDGWYLRSDIIWSKPNPMPESVYDRPTKSHEYIFLLAKSRFYYYDADAIRTEPKYPDLIKYAWGRAIDASIDDPRKGTGTERRKAVQEQFKNLPEGQKNIRKARTKSRTYDETYTAKTRPNGERQPGFKDWDDLSKADQMRIGANKRSVWTVPTHSFQEAHFATFPPELIVDPIKAGSSQHGCCSACGAPYIRQTKKTLVPTDGACNTHVIDERDHKADKQSRAANFQKDGVLTAHVYQVETLGWKASCKCEAPIVKCRVLEPFSGAGTTALVANKLGRDFVAIELSGEYVPMSENRLSNELGMFSPLP